MGETDAGFRDRDENKPENLPLGSKYRVPLNNSVSLSGSSSCLDSNSSSSSKSNSPDHVVPSEKGIASPRHRLSTSSGSSSPQTDGSITFRRHVGPDVSRSSSIGRSVVDELSPLPCRTTAVGGRQPGKEKIGNIKERRLGIKEKKIGFAGKKSSQPRLQKITKRKGARKQVMQTADSKPRKDEEIKSESDYVIRCICSFKDILGEQIQCEKCEVWQHFGCMGIQQSAVPDRYLCEVCDPIVQRPLGEEEARDLHAALLVADAHSVEERARKKAKRLNSRKPSDSQPVQQPLGETDLIPLDKKKADITSISTVTKSAEETGADRAAAAQKDDMSRDDRKILQYEQMFKRMEERKTKRGKRKRNPEGSSNGSPSRDLGGRDPEDESHEDSTNPPSSPPNMAALSVVETSYSLITESVFIAPIVQEIFTIPTRESLPLRTRRVRLSKEEKAKLMKDSSASESDTATAERAEKKKARYSMRLRNSASSKVAADSASLDDSRIELNCVKKSRKKDDGEGGQDYDVTIPTMSLPFKRRIRTTSFIDSYYSNMAEFQTETEVQKNYRRDRAYSASQEWEKVKVEQEKSRLYHMYGLKKAVCARFHEEPIDNLLETAARHAEARLVSFKFAQADVFSGPPLLLSGAGLIAQKRAASPEALSAAAIKRSRTVRAMIEESVRKNNDYASSHQIGHERMAAAHPPFKRQDNVHFTRPPITTAEIISAATALRSDVFGKTNSLSDVLGKSSLLIDVNKTAKPEATASAGIADFIGAVTFCDQNAPEAAETDALTVIEPELTVVTPKKLSLAEYKQRKLKSQTSTDSLTTSSFLSSTPVMTDSPIATPVKSAASARDHQEPSCLSPANAIPVDISPLRVTASPVCAFAVTATPSRMTSVIQRTGTVNSNLIPLNPAEVNTSAVVPCRSSGSPTAITASNHIPRPSVLDKHDSKIASSIPPALADLSQQIRSRLPTPSGHPVLNTTAFVQNFRPSPIPRSTLVDDLKT